MLHFMLLGWGSVVDQAPRGGLWLACIDRKWTDHPFHLVSYYLKNQPNSDNGQEV